MQGVGISSPLLFSKMKEGHETVIVKWPDGALAFQLSRLPPIAAYGSLMLFMDVEGCCGPGGTLLTVGYLLEQISTRQ